MDVRPLNTSHSTNNPSPLWIIALFLALTQTIAGSAAIATDGTAELIFAVFAVTFPFVVLGAFVWLLLFRPLNLYSPNQYKDGVSIGEFAEGLNRQDRDMAAIYRQAVTEAVVAGVAEDLGSASDDVVDPQAVRTRVAARFNDVIDQSSVTLDRSLLRDGARSVQIPVTSSTTVDEFLDSVWFNISESVEPYTYNRTWILADDDLVPLDEIGTSWANGQGWLGDDRRLEEAGIALGGTYFALPKATTLPGTRISKKSWRSQRKKLITRYEYGIQQEGHQVRRVQRERRPSLVTTLAAKDYGLYVMVGRAEASWVSQAARACSALVDEEGSEVVPILALDREPRDDVRRAGTEQEVAVMWIDNAGEFHGAPWRDT